MAGCKRCAPKGGEGKVKRREKKRKKEEKNGDHFFYIRAHVFSYAQWSFFKYI